MLRKKVNLLSFYVGDNIINRKIIRRDIDMNKSTKRSIAIGATIIAATAVTSVVQAEETTVSQPHAETPATRATEAAAKDTVRRIADIHNSKSYTGTGSPQVHPCHCEIFRILNRTHKVFGTCSPFGLQNLKNFLNDAAAAIREQPQRNFMGCSIAQ